MYMYLHELRRRVLAQALARARGAARVARGVVEGEPRLGGVATSLSLFFGIFF